ncbi:hypothetical protein ACIA8K_13630 [Catenuloplanes sp. NPDC051500]|uniref:hypothetical protein n=1 Tax=Catenuloplanes sp. NPDC051500 TaxID=3363959 RepID=UPI003799952E
MSAPPYDLQQTDEFKQILEELQKPQYARKLKKVVKALRLLRDVGPRHPGLNSHLYQSLKGPNGNPVWESYVENHTPSAWRIFWEYGPEDDQLTIITVGPHP